MIAFGNFAVSATIDSYMGGITKINSECFNNKFNIKQINSVHPSYCIYNPNGIDALNKSLKSFKDL
jgi:uracil-DNA glycosylase